MSLVYGSVCSGIEAATVAAHPLGWRPAFYSEIEPFPRAVLAHHYPKVPLHGDFTTIRDGEYEPIDLLVGGTPCQSFSVAGLRGGLDDDRGNLALEYLRLADRLRPRWLVWENVPGVLSSNGGRDFGSILGGMGELGYGVAYRVLDAQFFGLAQRRRRVFVVGYLGDWRRAAAVLFERHSLSGNPAPSREAGEKPAPTISSRPTGGGGLGTDFDLDGGLVAKPILAGGHSTNPLDDNLVTFAIQAGALRENPDSGPDGVGVQANKAYTLEARAEVQAIAFALRGREGGAMPEVGGDHVGALRTPGGGASVPMVASSAVRRLVPEECEALQGFTRGYTDIPWRGKPNAPDGPRYKALGNSMAVPCMAWIFQRIAAVEALPHEDELEDGMSGDDANDTVNSLITWARELAPQTPGHPANQGKGL